MSAQMLYRWAAAALIISGVSLALGLILHPSSPYSASVATAQWAVSHFFFWLGALAGVGGIAGLYLRQRERVGILGFAGSGISIIGLILIADAMYFEAFIAPPLATRRQSSSRLTRPAEAGKDSWPGCWYQERSLGWGSCCWGS